MIHLTTKDFRRIALATHGAALTENERLTHAAALASEFRRFTTFREERFVHACLHGKWDHEVGRKAAA